MTETELVLLSMTDEELEDAVRWLGVVHGRWLDRLVDMERRYGDAGAPAAEAFGHGTDGPMHLIRAMDLAVIRERAARGGAEPWEAGQPVVDHPARAFLRFYQERIALNPDEGLVPRLGAAGIVDKVCLGCQQAKPLTVAFWGWLGSSLDPFCRPCRAGNGPTAMETRVIDPGPAAEPVVPFTTDDLAEALDSLALL